MPKTPRDLLVRLPNWVGDVIMTLPTLQALDQNGYCLHLFGKPWIKDLLSAMDWNLYVYPKSLWQAKKYLATFPFKTLLLFTNSFGTALAGRLAGKYTIGYQGNGRSWLLGQALQKPMKLHEVEYFWILSQSLMQNFRKKKLPQKIRLPLSSLSIEKANMVLQQASIKQQPFWVFCPAAVGCSPEGHSKIWPYWQELCLSAQKMGLPIVVCPGPDEQQYFANRLPGVVLLNDLNLGEYAAILAKANGIIANDSGPMHVAAAVNDSVLGLFGFSDPSRTSPWGMDYLGKKGEWPTVEAVLGWMKKRAICHGPCVTVN